MREQLTNLHNLMATVAMLAMLSAALTRTRPAARRWHKLTGNVFVVTALCAIVAGGVLAAMSRNTIGILMLIMCALLVLSGRAQIRAGTSRRITGIALIVTGFGIARSFYLYTLRRDLIDVVIFLILALLALAFGIDDLRRNNHSAAQLAHAQRMLAAGWLFWAEFVIFLWDPQPSLIGWGLTAVAIGAPLALWRLRTRAQNQSPSA